MIELLQVTAAKFSLSGGFWTFLDNLDFGEIGYVVVGLFVAAWAFSVVLWKTRRIEARWGEMLDRNQEESERTQRPSRESSAARSPTVTSVSSGRRRGP